MTYPAPPFFIQWHFRSLVFPLIHIGQSFMLHRVLPLGPLSNVFRGTPACSTIWFHQASAFLSDLFRCFPPGFCEVAPWWCCWEENWEVVVFPCCSFPKPRCFTFLLFHFPLIFLSLLVYRPCLLQFQLPLPALSCRLDYVRTIFLLIS